MRDVGSEGQAVRSSNYGHIRHGTWTRLYKVQNVYLDLSLQRNSTQAVLLGQLIPVKDGQELVSSVITQGQLYSPLNDKRGFGLNLEAGLRDLHIHLGSELIVIRGPEA